MQGDAVLQLEVSRMGSGAPRWEGEGTGEGAPRRGVSKHKGSPRELPGLCERVEGGTECRTAWAAIS